MLSRFFTATAWPMAANHPGSVLHMAFTFAGITLTVCLAFLLSRQNARNENTVLPACGVILAVLELYKQGFLYYVVYNRHFNWWYFPFQLCSIPMYLCLIYPWLKNRPFSRKRIATFLQDFGLLGGIMALAVPDGLFHPYWTLTLHGFLWHFILILLGVYCGRKGLADAGAGGFFRMLPLYGLCCSIAIFINTMVQLCIYPRDYSDLFYINCFFPSEQPFFHQLSLWLGNVWGHILYVLASCCGAGLIHLAWAVYPRLHPRKKS